MSELLTQVSRVLKDNLITELKTNNDFYRNYLSKNTKSPLQGYKVIIKQHGYMNCEIFPETPGVIILLKKHSAVVAYKNPEQQILIKSLHINNLIITDPRAESLFQ